MSERTFIEFFAGIGLVHEAIKPFGWEAILANDNDPRKALAYGANFPTTTFSQEDVQHLIVADVGSVRLATASFPCIDLSQAGGREGIDGHKSSVVWAFLDRIAELKDFGHPPEFLFLENVPGLLSLHNGRSVDILLERIAELGYSFDVVQVDAEHFLPQTRNRVFIIGVYGRNRFPKSHIIPDHHIRRYKVRETYIRNPNLPWIFFNFPKLPYRKYQLKDIIHDIDPQDVRWWDDEKMVYFWSCLEKHHGPKLRTMLGSRDVHYMTATRRGRRRGIREQIINLRFDGMASCLRTPRGGSSTQFIVQLQDNTVRVRRILGIEAARLQGVKLPDSSPHFHLVGSENEQLFGFGDAVCIPTVHWVFKHSIEAVINGQEPRPVYENLMFEI